MSRLPFLLVLVALSAPAFSAQDPAPLQQDPPQDDPPKKLDAWPKLADEKVAKTDVTRLRKARTEEMAKQAHEALVAEGAAAAPLLLKALGHEKKEDALERIDAALTEITGVAHTRLLAKSLGDKQLPVRRWVLRRLAGLPDAGLLEVAQRHYAGVQAVKRKQDEDELYLSALFCASTGSTDGMDLLFSAAKDHWGKRGRELRTALDGVRGGEATELLLMGLHDAERQAKVTALRMLAGAGTKKALREVSGFLDSTDNSLRVEAINACRGIVDGDLPIEKLSVFDAVELAKKWKARV